MSESQEYTLVPYQQLSTDALQGVIEGFINREGTDYGYIEASLSEKCEQVLAQIRKGLVVIVFDHDSQSVSVMHKDQLV